MLQVQRFAIDNIYCASGQDKQFSFKLVRVNKKQFPVRKQILLYNTPKTLPNDTSFFQVFVLCIPPEMLNLLAPKRQWFKDTWIKASDDMMLRDYILKIYNDEGVMFPREHIFYSFIDQGSLMVAIESLPWLKTLYPVESFCYMHVYSNAYFNTVNYSGETEKLGIEYSFSRVGNNLEKVQLQNAVTNYRSKGGNVFIYVNGYWTPEISLNIPDTSCVEIVYDQSVTGIEYHPISGLRTFDSVKDDKLKYFLYRDTTVGSIQYQDDTELYVAESSGLVRKGLFFYRHQDSVMRNVTDKDYSITSSFIHNTAQSLANVTGGSLVDKVIVLYTRKSGRDMPLVYSTLKLHELYKLPAEVQKNVMSNNGYSVDILRVESLENSAYFQLASASAMSKVTPELAVSAVGYAGVSHYLADTPVERTTSLNVDVAELYQMNSLAFEYEASGLFTGTPYPTSGPLYSCSSAAIQFVDFQYGYIPPNFGRLYDRDETFQLLHPNEDYVILAAYFSGDVRESNWENVTTANSVSVVNGQVTLSLPSDQKAKVVYLSQLNIYDLQLSIADGVIYFPLTSYEDRGSGLQNHLLDVVPRSLKVFLNKHRLTQGVDFFVNFPYICITSKKYLRTDTLIQDIHIRATGYTNDQSKINDLEIRGFVNNGALTRNRKYDLRDDRVYSVYVDGKMYARDSVYFSETDNAVRLNHPLNGLTYVVDETVIPVKKFTGVDTLSLFETNQVLNTKVANLFNLVFPEPTINEFNVIGSTHKVYSPVVSKLIHDILTGVIHESVYMTPYDDSTVLDIIETNYKQLLKVDPVKFNMPDVLVTIHPHISNGTIDVTLFQYRFISNFVRILTGNNPSKINLSGYLSVST